MKNASVFCIRLVIATSLFLFVACRKCNCEDEDLNLNFVSFTQAEADTIVLKRYSKDSNFSTVIDSLSVSFFDGQNYSMQLRGDTISFPARPGNFSLNPNFDWIVFLPSINRNFRVGAVDKQQTRGDCRGDAFCVNPIRSLQVDGVPQVPKGAPFYQIYLFK